MSTRFVHSQARIIASRLVRSLTLLMLVLLPLTLTNAHPNTQSLVKSTPPTDSNGTTWSGSPPPGSKNATIQPATDPNGVTWSGSAAPGTKNYSPPQDSAKPNNLEAISAGSRFNTCGTIQDGGWKTTSSAFEVVVSCTLTFSEDGFVYMVGSTSMGVAGGNYEVRFNLNIDSTQGNLSTDRWVNAYTDSGDGTDKNVEASILAPVAAGTHTFYFLAARYSGTGTVQLYDPSLSVLYFPNSSADVLKCGASGDTVWNTSETSFQEIRSCSLNVPQSGYVYVSGTASSGLAPGGAAYEARFRVGVDDVSGTAASDRWVNVYTDDVDGTDEAVVSSLLTSVLAGPHTFYFSGARYNGVGPVHVFDPALVVLYFPAPNVTLKTCRSTGSDTWTNDTGNYSTIRSCSLNVPSNSFAFVTANASAGLDTPSAGSDWEGQFRLGIDNDSGFSNTDRWVNVYTDTNDGTDRPVAATALLGVSKGTHTFSFVGKRYEGAGKVRLYSPSLTVLVPGARLFMPLISR